MPDHRCLFCDRVFTGRLRNFCYECLPAHADIHPKQYNARYLDLYRACGRVVGLVGPFSRLPPGHPALRVEPPKPPKPPPAPVACLGCAEMVTPPRRWCSNRCRSINARRAVRSKRERSPVSVFTPAVVVRTDGTGVVCACAGCGAEFRRGGGRMHYCSKVCSDAGRRDRIRRKNVARRTVNQGIPYTLRQLAERDNHRCYLCGKRVNIDLPGTQPRGPHVDHLLPLSVDGVDGLENVALTHGSCNVRRGVGGEVQLRLVG